MSIASPRLWLLLALMLAGPSTFVSAQTLGSGLPARTLLDRYGLERAWANQATINVASDVVTNLVVDEEIVIVQTRSGMLTVFDAESGSRLWDGQLAVANQYSFPAVTNAENLFIVIGSKLYARDKYTGGKLWTLRLPNVPSTAPTVDEQRVYTGLITGDVYAYNLNELASLQERGLLPTWRRAARAWHVATSSKVIGPPVTNGRFAAFTNGQGVLYVFSADYRDLEFAFETNEPASAALALGTGEEDGVTKNYIYYAAGTNNFYSIRTTNGTTRWTYVSGAPIRKQPTVVEDDIFITPVDSGMYNLDPATGQEQWWTPRLREFVAASPTRVYGTDSAGNLAIVDRDGGGLVGTIPMKNYSVRFRNNRTDRIFVCTTRGRLACFKEQDLEQPIYHAHPARRPIVPIFPGDEVTEAPAPENAAEENAENAGPEADSESAPADEPAA